MVINNFQTGEYAGYLISSEQLAFPFGEGELETPIYILMDPQVVEETGLLITSGGFGTWGAYPTGANASTGCLNNLPCNVNASIGF